MTTIESILCRFSDALRALSGTLAERGDASAALCAAQAHLPEANREMSRKVRSVLWPDGVVPPAFAGSAQGPYATPYPVPVSDRLLLGQPLPIWSRADSVSYLNPAFRSPVGQAGQPVKIAPRQQVRIVARPQGPGFRLGRLILWWSPAHWDVHDILIGGRSQFQARGRIPGALLSADHDIGLRLETCQTSMDLTLVVEYVGPDEDGAAFDALALGATS